MQKLFKTMKETVYMNRSLYVWVLILSIVCVAFSIAIELEKTQTVEELNTFCDILGNASSCQIVQHSAYSQLFGFDNAYLGMIGFSVIAVLSAFQIGSENRNRRAVIACGSVLSGIMALIFLSIQTFVIKLYCILCVVVDAVSIILLCMGIFLLSKHRDLHTLWAAWRKK
jgi:uncharacterized membrane protein